MFIRKRRLLFLLIIFLVVLFSTMNTDTVSAAEGYITEIDFEQNSIKVKNNWYFLQENTLVERNNTIGSLKSCESVKGNKQWAQLEFADSGELIKIIVNYYIVEGIIKNISYTDKTITVNIFKQTGSLMGEHSFAFNNTNEDKLKCFTNGDHIVLITTCDRVLQVKTLQNIK